VKVFYVKTEWWHHRECSSTTLDDVDGEPWYCTSCKQVMLIKE